MHGTLTKRSAWNATKKSGRRGRRLPPVCASFCMFVALGQTYGKLGVGAGVPLVSFGNIVKHRFNLLHKVSNVTFTSRSLVSNFGNLMLESRGRPGVNCYGGSFWERYGLPM